MARNHKMTATYTSHWNTGNTNDDFISSIALRKRKKNEKTIKNARRPQHYYDETGVRNDRGAYRLPSTMSAMDSRMRLRKNTMISSIMSSAAANTTVNHSQVVFVFSLAWT